MITTEQFANARTQVALLHTALTAARNTLNDAGLLNDQLKLLVDAALETSESEGFAGLEARVETRVQTMRAAVRAELVDEVTTEVLAAQEAVRALPVGKRDTEEPTL